MSEADLAHLRDEALRLVEDALKKPPTELKSEVDDAERAVAVLRDAWIDHLRAQPTPWVRNNLDMTNVSLSLIVGLEYPMGGLQRDMLDQARQALERVEVEPPAD
jgi:hypothetical protein